MAQLRFLQILFIWFLSSRAQALSLQEASRSPSWLRLYQYVSQGKGEWQSPVASPYFFFSRRGFQDPQAELQEARKAFENPESLWGVQRQPAACVFPARRQVLEDLLQTKFPEVSCPDLQVWRESLGATQASLVFVGAYPGNPASILGHTFLRLINSHREALNKEGVDLLSYSVGFMAQVDPQAGRVEYMLKGLTGGFDGFYEIEPYYMKVGLYNNSESRDLWDLRLKLTPQEVDLLVLHIWEFTFNGKIPYYFIGENCAFRVLKLIEAIRPSLDLTSHLPVVVLPSETVREAMAVGLTENYFLYRPSVQRRLEFKLELLDKKGRSDFQKARKSLSEVLKLDDATVLDALLDYWLYKNYRVNTHLQNSESEIMDATYHRAAQVNSQSRFIQFSNEDILRRFDLSPPFLGHKPRWVDVNVGGSGESKGRDKGSYMSFSYRSGAHPFWSGDPSYNEVAAIHYFGVDLEKHEQESLPRWALTLVNVKSISEFMGWEPKWSWEFQTSLHNHCRLCATSHPTLDVSGGGGMGHKTQNTISYVMVRARAAAWETSRRGEIEGLLAPGWASGFRVRFKSLAWSMEAVQEWWKIRHPVTVSMRLSQEWSKNKTFYLRGEYESSREKQDELLAGLGFVYFF